jgi:putative membrane protein
MRWMGACVAFALAMVPALAHAEDKGTTRTTGQSQVTSDKQPMSTAMPMTEKEAASTSRREDASSGEQASNQEAMTDARFVALMHHVNQDEINAGKLAQKKGKSSAVKSFGKTLVTDHTKSDQKLLAAAKKAGITPRDSALTTKDKEQAKIEKNKMDELKHMSGARFDKGFAQVMSNGHEHVIKMVRDAKDELKSQDLKTYADNTIPVLEKHKDLADQVLHSRQEASAGENQGRTPPSVEHRITDTSKANHAGKNPEGNRGDESSKSGPQNQDR